MPAKVIMSMLRGGIEKVLKELNASEYQNNCKLEPVTVDCWHLTPKSFWNNDGYACCVTIYPSNNNFPNEEYILTMVFRDHSNIKNPDIETMKKYCEKLHATTTLPVIGNGKGKEIYYGDFARLT